MSSLPARLVGRLACPRCRGSLEITADGAALRCRPCGTAYPVEDGIPHLFPEQSEAHAGAAVAAHYDGIAPHYDDTIPAHVAAHYRAKRVGLVRTLLEDGALLDVGCGTGTLAAALAGAGYEVTGIDASPGMLARLHERCGAAAVAGFSERLPFANGAFDGAITVATLHHIAAPERVEATIAEMARVVRPGGVVVLWDHNPENPYWPILMRRVPQDTGEERLVPLQEILAALRATAVRDVRAYRLGFVPDFVPAVVLPAARAIEAVVERTPGLRRWAAHNVVVGVKRET